MTKAKRHESLIPLSREHHYGLMLCLRINRGLADNGGDAGWLQSKVRQASIFFETNLVMHFKAEEEILFPAMQEIAQAAALIMELRDEHQKLERLVEQLRSEESNSTEATLRTFAGLLEAHIRKEERLLFPIYESEIQGTTDEQVGRNIQALIGTALQPTNPELLEP